MSTPYQYILTTGVIKPDAAEIQTEVQTEYTNTFGSDFNVTSTSTPQGLLINAETQARIAVATNNATLANQINPNFAGGVFLDAILALMGSQRTPATNSSVLCNLTGSEGTVIPAGSLAQDTNGNQWQIVNTTTIPVGGIYDGALFQAVATGSIVVNATDLNIIISNVLGWVTISNPNSNQNSATGTVGQSTQSDVQARQYRINTLYLQSNGLAGSIIAALTATETVNSLYFIENPSSSPTTIQGVAMNANSIYVCVDGTNTQAIAATLTATKSAGCAYTNGASQSPQSINYTVPLSGQVITVLFDFPDIITINVQIVVTLYTPIQDYQTSIIDAIKLYAAGGVDGLQGLTVGHSVSPFEISAAVGIQYPGVYVTSCTLGDTTPVIQTGTLNGTATITGLTDVTVLLQVGMQVSDGAVNIPGGTFILSITNNTTVVMTQAATGSATESITFTGVNYLPTTIDIAPWQKAVLNTITVSLTP